LVFPIFFGIPFICIVGLIVSSLLHKQGKNSWASLSGYAAAALLVGGYELVTL
jgi:hypothetical protein